MPRNWLVAAPAGPAPLTAATGIMVTAARAPIRTRRRVRRRDIDTSCRVLFMIVSSFRTGMLFPAPVGRNTPVTHCQSQGHDPRDSETTRSETDIDEHA